MTTTQEQESSFLVDSQMQAGQSKLDVHKPASPYNDVQEHYKSAQGFGQKRDSKSSGKHIWDT